MLQMRTRSASSCGAPASSGRSKACSSSAPLPLSLARARRQTLLRSRAAATLATALLATACSLPLRAELFAAEGEASLLPMLLSVPPFEQSRRKEACSPQRSASPLVAALPGAPAEQGAAPNRALL